MTVTFRRLPPLIALFPSIFLTIFFLLHLNLSYTKRIVLLVPVENIKIRNITTLFLDWPNWIVINIIVINITVGRYFSYICTCSFSWYSKSSSISSSRMTIFPKSIQSVLQSSGRAPGAMGSKFSHIFLREVSLGEKLYFGGKMICCNFFLTNKELMDRKTKRHKDKHRNNCESCQSQVTWKLEFKCQFPLSCLSIIICTTCDFLFIRYVDLIHYNWPHSGQKSLSLFHPVMEILGPLIDISGLLWFQELLSLE